MRISDIKGERAFLVIADIMDLAADLSKDKRFDKLMKELKEAKGKEADSFMVLMKAAPLIRDERYYKRIISILAEASGVDAAEYAKNGDVIGDIKEILLSDLGVLDFFDSAQTSQE